MESGAFVLNGGASGAAFRVSNVIARDCNDHCMLTNGGRTISKSLFVDSYWGPSTAATMIADYEATTSGLPLYASYNVFQQAQNIGNATGVAAIIGHTGDATVFGNVVSTEDWFIAKNGANLSGVLYKTSGLLICKTIRQVR